MECSSATSFYSLLVYIVFFSDVWRAVGLLLSAVYAGSSFFCFECWVLLFVVYAGSSFFCVLNAGCYCLFSVLDVCSCLVWMMVRVHCLFWEVIFFVVTWLWLGDRTIFVGVCTSDLWSVPSYWVVTVVKMMILLRTFKRLNCAAHFLIVENEGEVSP